MLGSRVEFECLGIAWSSAAQCWLVCHHTLTLRVNMVKLKHFLNAVLRKGDETHKQNKGARGCSKVMKGQVVSKPSSVNSPT